MASLFKTLIRQVPERSKEPVQAGVYQAYALAIRALKIVGRDKVFDSPAPDAPESERRVFGPKSVSGPHESIPPIVWIYWNTESRPFFVRAAMDQIRAASGNLDVREVSDADARHLVPGLDQWRSDLLPANRADLIRLELLYRYGGIWIDSTAVPGRPLAWVLEWSEMERLSFVSFFNRAHSTFTEYPVVENWFLASAPGDRFVREWLSLLEPLKTVPKSTLYAQLLSDPLARRISETIPDPFYRIPYLAAQIAYERTKDRSRLGLIAADDEAFHLFGRTARNSWDVALNTLVRPAPNKPLIMMKFTRRDRLIIDAFKRFAAITPQSVVGRIVSRSFPS